MSETKISQPVLDAHAQFGGDLESMQKLYDYASLVEENRRLREALKLSQDSAIRLQHTVDALRDAVPACEGAGDPCPRHPKACICWNVYQENSTVVVERREVCGAAEATELIELREWKQSVINACKGCGSDELSWGGDKTGWGFIYYFIKHLHTRAEATEGGAHEKGTAWEELCKLTFAVQHNPNCPSPWLVRLAGKGPIDMKPYGDPLGLVRHQTGDILGFGKTLDEAARAALVGSEKEGGDV